MTIGDQIVPRIENLRRHRVSKEKQLLFDVLSCQITASGCSMLRLDFRCIDLGYGDVISVQIGSRDPFFLSVMIGTSTLSVVACTYQPFSLRTNR